MKKITIILLLLLAVKAGASEWSYIELDDGTRLGGGEQGVETDRKHLGKYVFDIYFQRSRNGEKGFIFIFTEEVGTDFEDIWKRWVSKGLKIVGYGLDDKYFCADYVKIDPVNVRFLHQWNCWIDDNYDKRNILKRTE